MALIIALDLFIILWLVGLAYSKGFESVLPLSGCLLLIFPSGAQIPLPGLFNLTTQRVIVLVLCGLYLSLGRSQQDEEAAAPTVPLRYLLVALIVWMLLSSARSVVPVVSFKSTLSQYFDYCTVYLVFARTLRKPELVDKVLAGFVAGMFICALAGVIEIYAGWKISSLFPPVPGRFPNMEDADDMGSRVQSAFDHAILFGAALVMAIPMALRQLTSAKDRRTKAYLWVALALMFLCVYKCGSRGAWIALVLAMAAVVVLGSARIRASVGIIAMLALVIVVARPGIRDTVSSLYGATLDPDSQKGESYEWRYVLYHIASRELSKDFTRSLWGYGPESFYYLGLTTDFSIEGEMHTVKVESCDSAVVELMMDTGYVGLLLVAALLGSSAVQGFRHYRSADNPGESYYVPLLASLIAFFFLMTNVELFGWGQQSYMLWIMLALLARSVVARKEDSAPNAFHAFPQVQSSSI